jgi:hypothetical protein
VYVNPATATIVAQFSRRQRIERWAYHGLHSLDFWNALVGTPAWRTSLVALCVAGSALSALGLLAGVRRLITPVNRRRRAAAPSGT